jgi:putative SOS response-associated peptidase YedK
MGRSGAKESLLINFIYMCYAIAYLTKRLEKYAQRYGVPVQPATSVGTVMSSEFPVYYFVSGFDHPALPVITSDGISFSRWGLIPSWVNNTNTANELRTKTLNAMGETVFEKPSFRKAIVTKRCLLGINGFFEWRLFNKIKYPYLITSKSNEIFSLGCLYDTWQNPDTGEKLNTFSVITTPANPLMEKIHNTKKRMPLIIPEDCEKDWISAGLSKPEVAVLIKPYDERDMKAITISQKVNFAKNNRNVPDIMNPVGYPELSFFGNELI